MEDIIQTGEKYKAHPTFTKEERSDYEEPKSRNICYIFHSGPGPGHNMEHK
jgi:hypothetical protein